MCGISGFNFSSESLIKSMNDSLKHRGPDGSSFFVDNKVSLGHARLSIIDLSNAGQQPMLYNSYGKKLRIVFNGEIYNYLEIKERLIKLGYEFFTNTDTEVILVAYVEWNEKCVNELNGMWSFCIYDEEKNILFCSRDRLGVKPFYYYYQNERFIFSSELKSILEHKSCQINQLDRINLKSVELYFSLGFIPAPDTIYKNVSKLQAGHNLFFDLETSTIKEISQYYVIPVTNKITNKVDLLDEGRFLIRDSVRLRMRSDVSVGAFLSGGLDSSTVVGEMKHFTDTKSLHTFSIGFEDKKYDESNYINLVKDYFKTNHHHHIYLEEEFNSMWQSYSDVFDEPFGDYSSFPSYHVCRMAHKDVTVVLSGDGGDEIFGGYPIYNRGFLFEKLQAIPRFARNLFYKTIIKEVRNDKRLEKVAELLRLSLLPRNNFYSEMLNISRYKPEAYKEFTQNKLTQSLDIAGGNLAEGLRIYDLLFNTLSDNYLVKVDRTSMSNSLEVRSPFLDYRFVEFSQKIPVNFKVGFFQNKILMRELIKDIVPSEILTRNKMGFTPPIGKWLYNSISTQSIFKYHDYLKNLNNDLHSFYQRLLFSEKNNGMYDFYIIKLAIFGKWYERWILGESSAAS